jgi:hypothetical protein
MRRLARLAALCLASAFTRTPCRHVWLTRYIGYDITPNGRRRYEVSRWCQVCFLMESGWEEC